MSETEGHRAVADGIALGRKETLALAANPKA
jgi:hypothetical protein